MAPDRTDQELLKSADPEDFGVFYLRHVDVVTAYAARRSPGPATTFDLVSEVFARALEHRDRYSPAQGPAAAWLLGILKNLIIDAGRRGGVAERGRRRLAMEPVELDDAALARIDERGSVDLFELLSSLPEEQRYAVEQRVLHEEPYERIALRSHSSEQVVRQRVSRGLAQMRRALGGTND